MSDTGPPLTSRTCEKVHEKKLKKDNKTSNFFQGVDSSYCKCKYTHSEDMRANMWIPLHKGWHTQTGMQGIHSAGSTNTTVFLSYCEWKTLCESQCSVFLPHSWQLFISKPDQYSLSVSLCLSLVSSPYLLSLLSSWRSDLLVNMLVACSLQSPHTSACRAQLRRCWQCLLVQQQQQQPAASSQRPGLTPSSPPSYLLPPPSSYPLPSLCLINFQRQTSTVCACGINSMMSWAKTP